MEKEESKIAWQKAIRKALEFYEDNEWDNNSTIYDVVYNGKNYPPKEVYKKAIDFFLVNYPAGHIPSLRGGDKTNEFIRKHGFIVIGGQVSENTLKICKLQMRSDADGKNYVDEVLADNRITGHIDFVKERFANLNRGDIVLVHKGSEPHTLVEIANKITDKTNIKGESLGIDFSIKILSNYSDVSDKIKFKVGHKGSFQILKDKTSNTYQSILSWLNYLNPKNHMENYIQLLKYKKQIILQGPPGTGKTRLAKEIAKIITSEKEQESIIDSINTFFKKFSPSKEDIEARKAITAVLLEFQDKFPKDNLKNLKLEEYALGTDEKDGFCYWLEYGLHNTGQYNGQASKGKIFWSKEDQSYKKSGFVKDIEEDEKAMKMLADLLHDIANENFQSKVDFPIGKGFVLKVLNTYYPEKYFPINNEKLLDKLLTVFGKNDKSLNYIEKSRRAMEIFIDQRKRNKVDVTAYEFMNYLFSSTNLNGNLKIIENDIVSKGNYKVIQFHPSYSYEDFVRGISVKSNDKGAINYVVEDRILVQMANEASSNPKSNFVLIIDEINRANLSSVLGELIYSLEYRYDSEKSKIEGVIESVYDKNSDGEKSDRELRIPKNLYIIGTMNTADRSVGNIDYAVRRRFAFVDVLPKILNLDNFQKSDFQKISELFIKGGIADGKNSFDASRHLSEDFRPQDICIGHSYFIADRDTYKNFRLPYEIKPILKEYLKDGILKPSAEEFINSL